MFSFKLDNLTGNHCNYYNKGNYFFPDKTCICLIYSYCSHCISGVFQWIVVVCKFLENAPIKINHKKEKVGSSSHGKELLNKADELKILQGGE